MQAQTRRLPWQEAQDGSERESDVAISALSPTALFLVTLIVGIALMVVSYFYLAAPLGVPASEAFSNPRLPFAAGIFLLGVVVAFLSAVVYVLDGKDR